VVDESVKIATETISQPEKESNKIVLPEFESLGEIEQRIVEILDEYVAPAVSADGGMIRFISYEDKIVKVLLQGACSGCPSSTATLKQGISGLLQKMLPTLVKDVQAVNG
jgi:NFU1 iron-sulfur cluster scaffold homolog, mitochondrial